ncbi:MAG: isoprenylcysteine carboxylmethyltransferase family protein, partial [Gemmatimonadetes bacterium]|nr:isoprenylcysteine carboxylmethyltransferase family protein [Gemmatimonadota bacterium]
MRDGAGTMRSESTARESGTAAERLGRFLFRHRSLTPVPLVILLLLFARPTMMTAVYAVPFWLAGAAVRLSALRFIGGASRSTELAPSEIVTTGPFGAVRNPLYVGNFLLTAGFTVFSGHWLFALVPLLLFPIQYVPVVRAEEAELGRRFPDAFRDYARTVPRWLPHRPASLIVFGDAPRTWRES